MIPYGVSPIPQDYDRGSLYGLEKFWAFHHYGGLPKDSGVEINPKVWIPSVWNDHARGMNYFALAKMFVFGVLLSLALISHIEFIFNSY